VRALREAGRVGRPGGVVVAAAINRYAPRLDGVLMKQLYREMPHILGLLADEVEVTGVMPPVHPSAFTAYAHRPDELRAETVDAGLVVEDLVGVEGLAFAMPDLAERLADEQDRAVVLECARVLQRVPELLGLSPHLLVVARIPRHVLGRRPSELGDQGLQVVGDRGRVGEHREVAARPVVRPEHPRPAAVAGKPGRRVVAG
jgi:hypothetical protein